MSSQEAMIPTTVRIPIPLEKEIREFCAKENIHLSVVVRELLTLGWAAFRTPEADDETAE